MDIRHWNIKASSAKCVQSDQTSLKSFIIVVLGGMGSIWGSMVAAILLGVMESFFAVYVSYDYRDAFGLMVLIAVLLFRPYGLAGRKGRET